MHYQIYRPYLLHVSNNISNSSSNSCSSTTTPGGTTTAPCPNTTVGTTTTAAPLVVLHGGLGLPSDYLIPLVDQMTSPDRCIIFHDMLGCGRSESPSSIDMYSIPDAVHDLHLLLVTLRVDRFHIYAHSAGVVIAYEYLKMYNHGWEEHGNINHTTNTSPNHASSSTTKPCCISAVFSNGSFHIGLAKESTEEMEQRFVTLHPEHCGGSDEPMIQNENLKEELRKQVICRTDHIPLPLQKAYDKAGQVWKGLNVIQDYNAATTSTTCCCTCHDIRCKHCIPPILLLRGEYDFIVKELSVDGWVHVLSEHHCTTRSEMESPMDIQYITMKGCSHMPMLEDPVAHGVILNAFYKKHDIRMSG